MRFRDDDEQWENIVSTAREAISVANEELIRRCDEAGIRAEFRPEVGFRRGSGENASLYHRAELRRMAANRLEAMTKLAKLEIERASANMLTDLHSRALSSEESREWLWRMPTVEALLPPLTLAEIDAGE